MLQVYVTASSNYEVNIYELGDIDNFTNLTVVTPVIENTKTGYAVQGNELTGLDAVSLAAEEGIKAGGVVYADGGNSTNWNTAYGWGNHASQSYATQSYVGTQISNLVDSSPAALDTLNELAAALGDDPNFATTVNSNIASKLPLSGGTITSGQSVGLTINHDTFGAGLRIHRNHASNAPSIQFLNNSGRQGTLLAIDSDDSLYWQIGTSTTNNKIWHAGNDGASSGLDADLLDGQHGSYYYAASNPNGYTSNVGDITAVAAGSGLSGGGTSGTVTVNVGAGDGIDTTVNTVAVDSTVIRTTGNQTLGGTKTFSSEIVATGGNSTNWNTAYGWGNHASQSYATQSYVGTAISNLVDSSPATLDTLNELAAALGDDPNFATTVSTSIGTKWTQDNTKISNWDTAYGWGDHSTEGYLTSYTDTNTTYSAGTGISLSGTTFSLTDTNAKLSLAGGTMTGSIALSQNPVGTTYGNGVSTVPTDMISQVVGDNDGWRLYGEAPCQQRCQNGTLKSLTTLRQEIHGYLETRKRTRPLQPLSLLR